MYYHLLFSFTWAFFWLFSICGLLFTNNSLAVHSTFSSVISDSRLPNQFLLPTIFLVERLFFLSIAKLQKYPLTAYHYHFSFLDPLFSSVQSLLKCLFRSPMLKHYSTEDFIPVSTQLSPFFLLLLLLFFKSQPLLCSWQHFLTFSSFSQLSDKYPASIYTSCFTSFFHLSVLPPVWIEVSGYLCRKY